LAKNLYEWKEVDRARRLNQTLYDYVIILKKKIFGIVVYFIG
jgi:hypothetical protein